MASTKPEVHNEDAASDTGRPPLVVQLRPVLELTEEQFLAFSQLNRDLRLERNARGDLIIMPPTGGETGDQNADIGMQLRQWAKRDGTGTTFDSSAGFRLPNHAIRSPDAAWVSHSRLTALTAEQRKAFIPLCPDFVIELRSPTDSLAVVRDKMDEYITNGARLAWLLDAVTKRVYVYRPQAPVQRLDDPDTIPGDPVLPGFALDLREVW
jgi:Uma2 family endonuclease